MDNTLYHPTPRPQQAIRRPRPPAHGTSADSRPGHPRNAMPAREPRTAEVRFTDWAMI